LWPTLSRSFKLPFSGSKHFNRSGMHITWRRRHQPPPKFLKLFTNWYGVTIQKTWIFH
jgi:hypothetical protein